MAFEQLAGELFAQAAPLVEDLRVAYQDKVEGTDGAFVFDATIRYRFAGLDFRVVVEAKRHRDPIKREVLQVLNDKARSVGAHKAVLVSTSPFQTGALKYAELHKIGLVHVADEVEFVMRDMVSSLGSNVRMPDRRVAVARVWALSDDDKLSSTMVSSRPEEAAGLLLGTPPNFERSAAV